MRMFLGERVRRTNNGDDDFPPSPSRSPDWLMTRVSVGDEDESDGWMEWMLNRRAFESMGFAVNLALPHFLFLFTLDCIRQSVVVYTSNPWMPEGIGFTEQGTHSVA